MVCDANGAPSPCILSSGQGSDIAHAKPLLDQVRILGEAYSWNQQKLKSTGGNPRNVDEVKLMGTMINVGSVRKPTKHRFL